jgi:hypothetical protein
MTSGAEILETSDGRVRKNWLAASFNVILGISPGIGFHLLRLIGDILLSGFLGRRSNSLVI